MQTPPITALGIEARKVTNGPKNDITIAKIAVVRIVTIEALPVIATQPIDSPYVVLGHPPKNAPTIDPTPSPRSVLSNPGFFNKSFLIIVDNAI